MLKTILFSNSHCDLFQKEAHICSTKHEHLLILPCTKTPAISSVPCKIYYPRFPESNNHDANYVNYVNLVLATQQLADPFRSYFHAAQD